MLYIRREIYKDKLSDIDLSFIKVKVLNQKKSLWQPVKKIMPFVYIKRYGEFVDYTDNFEAVKKYSLKKNGDKMTIHSDANVKYMAISTLYNLSIMTDEFKVIRKQFYAGDINGAVTQGEEFGRVFKVVESISDNEDHLFRMRG